MKVLCSLCDVQKELDDTSLLVKKLRNHPITMYICDSCYDRITEKRSERLKNLVHEMKSESDEVEEENP